MTKNLANVKRFLISEQRNQNLEDQDLYFLEEKRKFELDSKVMAHFVPRISFFSNIPTLDFKKQKEILIKYEISNKSTVTDANLSSTFIGKSKAKIKRSEILCNSYWRYHIP